MTAAGECARGGDMRDLAERDQHLTLGSATSAASNSCGGLDLVRLGLVCGRKALDRVEDDRARQSKPVGGAARYRPRQARTCARSRVEQLAGKIAGERPPRCGWRPACPERGRRSPTRRRGRRMPEPARSTSRDAPSGSCRKPPARAQGQSRGASVTGIGDRSAGLANGIA